MIRRIAIGLTAASMALASPAHADPTGFYDYLIGHGLTVKDRAVALEVGNWVCESMSNGYSGYDVAVAVYQGLANPSADDAAAIVVGAVQELCPDNQPNLKGFNMKRI